MLGIGFFVFAFRSDVISLYRYSDVTLFHSSTSMSIWCS